MYESEEGLGTTFSVFLPLGGRESARGTSNGAGVSGDSGRDRVQSRHRG
jgi:hypothetical protein